MAANFPPDTNPPQNRPQQGYGPEQLPRRMLAAPQPPLSLGGAAQPLQGTQLFVEPLRPAMQTRLAQLRQPLPAMPATVRFLPRARDRLAAIQRFHPAHHPRRVFGQRGVTADQFLQGARAAFPVLQRNSPAAGT